LAQQRRSNQPAKSKPASSRSSPQPESPIEEQIRDLLNRKKYRQAIDKLHQAQKQQPDVKFSITEASIWLMRGEQEFEVAQYQQAENSFQQAFKLSADTDTYYWLAKTLLQLNQPAKALELFQEAFTAKRLPKELGGCYIKLLVLNEQLEPIETILKTKSLCQRFFADHLHWARGAVALIQNNHEAAITHFSKLNRPVSQKDRPTLWTIFAHQRAGDWATVDTRFAGQLRIAPRAKQSFFPMFSLSSQLPENPVVEALALSQAIGTGRSPLDVVDIDRPKSLKDKAIFVLEMLHLIEQNDFHNAVHCLQGLPTDTIKLFELDNIRHTLLKLAGQQALQEGEYACAIEFLSKVVHEPIFNPQVAVHLHKALRTDEQDREAQALVNQFIRWVEKMIQQQPQDWPEQRRTATLAKLYCWLTDSQLALGHQRDAERSIKQAIALAPEHPDVIGRQGLLANGQGKASEAIPLLKRALEAGCLYISVYETLKELLIDTGDKETLKAIRRQFGQTFGDMSPDQAVDIPDWVSVLSTQSYALFTTLIEEYKQSETPDLKALEIFVAAAEGEPNANQRVTLNQAQASKQWEVMLASLEPATQVIPLLAILLVIQLYAKRNQKGLTALQTSYFHQLVQLKLTVPQAAEAHLVFLAVRGLSKQFPKERLAIPFKEYLSRTTDPNSALAQIHLQAHRFGADQTLQSLIDEALAKDSQNPLLLLAKATTYPHLSAEYQTFYDQGFELARRLQDAQALQAYREEEWLITHRAAQEIMPDLMRLGDPSQLDQIDIRKPLRQMIRKMLGNDIPPAILEAMVSEFLERMESEMGSNEFWEEDDDDGPFPFPFPLPRPPRTRRSKSRKGFSK
jgi:tetratricopeptide (TPR) repeat protein